MHKKFKKIMPTFLFSSLKRIFFVCSFIYDYMSVKKHFMSNGRFSFFWKDRYPQLYDKTSITPFDRHYIYHPAWAARIIKKINPKRHIDISSILSFIIRIEGYLLFTIGVNIITS